MRKNQKCTHLLEAIVKKRDTPMGSMENMKYSQLIIFNFKTLSQIFLQNILRHFQFMGKTENWLCYTNKCTQIEEALVKKKDTTTEHMENT